MGSLFFSRRSSKCRRCKINPNSVNARCDYGQPLATHPRCQTLGLIHSQRLAALGLLLLGAICMEGREDRVYTPTTDIADLAHSPRHAWYTSRAS